MKRKKKRPELNTNKTENGTFFPPVQKVSEDSKATDTNENEADSMANNVVNSVENKNVQEKEIQTAAFQKKEED